MREVLEVSMMKTL